MLRFATSLASKAMIPRSSSSQLVSRSRLSWNRKNMFAVENRAAISRGVEALADAVKVTMGPKGRNVLLQDGVPKVTKNGLTVANSIEFKSNPFMNFGAGLITWVATHTNNKAGDGTTCATILTHAIFSEGTKFVAAGANAVDLKRGINMAVDAVVENLKRRARMISTSEEIARVGTTLANGEKEVGELIATAMERVGKGGVIITSADGKSSNELEVVKGMKLDRLYAEPYYINSDKYSKCEMEDCLILIYYNENDNFNFMEKVIELALKKQKKSLLIVTGDIEEKALDTLFTLTEINKDDWKLKVCALKALGFAAYLEDLAILTGGEVLTGDPEEVTFEMLGSCKKVMVSYNETIIVDAHGDKKSIEERCEQVRSEIELCTCDHKDKVREWLARLSGGVAVLKIGGASEAEIVEKKDRVTVALNATKAAVEEGIVPGGGVALLYASKELEKLQTGNVDEKVGVEIIKNALKAPVCTIASNAGVEGAVVAGKLLEQDDEGLGYDAAKGEYVDMVEAGIIDPLKVIRTALVVAASGAWGNIEFLRDKNMII